MHLYTRLYAFIYGLKAIVCK